MIVTRIKLKNWRNFKDVDIPLRERAYLIGPNASGKSNFLDVFRFLRDISNPSGGGLRKAILNRGGIKKVRWLPSRDAVVSIEVHLAQGPDEVAEWKYSLAFRSEGTGLQRPVVTNECVIHHNKTILSRPDSGDEGDTERLTQTHLEQINTNGKFRDIAETFDSVTYLHLVPQLLKFSDQLGGNRLSGDPFGQEFLKRYKHWRPKAGLQREDEFSDGTLRLLGLMWSLLDGDSMLLLEEPELSLNDGIVSQIPMLISGMQRKAKHRRQVIITTHSEALLNNEGIDGREVIRLEPTENGTEMLLPNEEETVALKAGLTPADVILSKARPHQVEQLSLLE